MFSNKGLYCSLVVLLICGTPFAAERTDVDLAVSVGLGYDSNPVVVSGETSGGLFSEIRFDSELKYTINSKMKLFANGYGSGRDYESEHANGDKHRIGLRAGMALYPYMHANRSLSIALGGKYDRRRTVFTDPLTGNHYEYVFVSELGDIESAEIPDRFEHHESSIFLDMRWKLNDSARISLEAMSRRTDYTEDYPDLPDLRSLDHRTGTVRCSILFRTTGAAWIELYYAWTDRDYDHQTARLASGEEEPDVTRSFGYSGYGASLRYFPRGIYNLSLGFIGSDRSDEFRGYYDSSGRTTYISAGRQVLDDSRLIFYGSRRNLSYDHATIANRQDGDLRGSETVKLIARYEHGVTERIELFIETGIERSDDQDPLYSYDKDWAKTGFRYRID